MRTGFLIPISSEALGFALIVTLIGFIAYAIIYSIRASTKRVEVNNLKDDFQRNPEVSEKQFGFPAGSFLSYSVKHFDERLGFATQRMKGQFGLAMCIHSSLPHVRLYFFYDFATTKRIQAILYLENQSEERLMLKQTPESTMFAHEDVRYFHIPHKDGPSFFRNAKKFIIDDEEICLDSGESFALKQMIDEFFSYSTEDRDNFLTWSKAS